MSTAPLQFLLLLFAGWVNRRQHAVIEYILEEKIASSANNSAAGNCGSPTTNAVAWRRRAAQFGVECSKSSTVS